MGNQFLKNLLNNIPVDNSGFGPGSTEMEERTRNKESTTRGGRMDIVLGAKQALLMDSPEAQFNMRSFFFNFEKMKTS